MSSAWQPDDPQPESNSPLIEKIKREYLLKDDATKTTEHRDFVAAHNQAVEGCIKFIVEAEKGITHYIQVGQFLLSHGRSRPGNVWIEVANDGEGGEFNQSDLEPVLKEFYDKHF